MDEPEHALDSSIAIPATAVLSYGRHAPDDPPPLLPSTQLETVDSETRHYRRDGWTPAARAAFLETLARSGVVTDACKEVRRSSQAAYALRNRDPAFAAGWDAAVSMARPRLADELFHRAVHGTVDQVWKDGEVVAERHRHDNRLSIAVLNRLDARSDRAERVRSPSLRLVAGWDAYLAALAEDRTADLEEMLAPEPDLYDDEDGDILGRGDDAKLIHQFHQLGEGKALDEAEEETGPEKPRIWVQDHTWRTDYPPPAGFRGDQRGAYGDQKYDRQCTPEEWVILDASFPNAFVDPRAEKRKADETERAALFAELAADLDPAQPDGALPGDAEEEQSTGDGGENRAAGTAGDPPPSPDSS